MNGAQWEAFFLPPLFAGRRRGHSAFSFISARRRSAGKFPALFLPGIKKSGALPLSVMPFLSGQEYVPQGLREEEHQHGENDLFYRARAVPLEVPRAEIIPGDIE